MSRRPRRPREEDSRTPAGAGEASPPRRSPQLPRFAELEQEYEILRELGRGGTAVVYLARERELGRKVAIKVIRSSYVEDEEAAARLVREARTVAGLQHPNIVMLYGTRRLRDHSLALIMQYVQGRTLKAEIAAAGALPAARAVHILSDMAQALAYAHRRRIVHRDLKPENIYIDELGLARLSDFGIARPWGDSSLTLPGSAIGTPAYMSPEQIDGGPLDGRSDLYSLGLVGWEMLSGRRPWAGESLFGTIYKQKHEPLPDLARLRPGLPRDLLRAIERALAKEPENRWPDAESFLAALTGGQDRSRRSAESAGAAAAADEKRPDEREGALPFEAPEPDPEALTIQYRPTRPGRAVPAVPPPAAPEQDPTSLAPVDPPRRVRRASRAPAAPPARVHEASREAAAVEPVPEKRRRGLLAAAVLVLFLTGTAVLMGVNQWGVDHGRTLGAAGAAAAAPGSEVPPLGSDPPAESAGVPGRLVMLGAEAQEGVAGDTLPEPLAVRVEDAAGRPLPGVPVRFAVTGGGGRVVAAADRSDATGTVRARWIPAAAGLHSVEVRAGEDGGPVARFVARVLPRAPASLVRVSPERAQGIAGQPVAEPFVISVADDRGRPLAGAAVAFAVRSGAGRVRGDRVTRADGTARATWVLGSAGEQELVATVEGLPADTLVFRATGDPAPLAVRSGIAVGGTHTCLLGRDGRAACWGGNDNGQLGDGSASRRSAPTAVQAPEPLAALAAGVSHTCGVGVSGSIFCWGANSAGQLGDGRSQPRVEPVRVAADARFTAVAAGMSHSCALTGTGALFCWGQNAQGQLGDGTRSTRPAPVPVAGGRSWRSVAPGWSHTCALARDGAAYCWGRNSSGELGDGTTRDRLVPTRVAGGHRFTALAAGSAHTCGLRTDGAVLCWGTNRQGQLGSATEGGSAVPAAVAAGSSFTALAVGGLHTCALARDGTASCWGRNNYGQLGDGTFEDRAAPGPVAGERRFTSLAASGAHTCATAAGGQEFCWGLNLEGQLGDGSRNNQPRPVAVRRPS